MKSPKSVITILTATLNAELCIGSLIDSLLAQTDSDFEWVIVDGCSSDGTLELLQAVQGLRIRILSAKDFGIYDALNRGIQAIDHGYYLVLGSDDILFPEAIELYRDALSEKETDIVTASVLQNGHVISPRTGLGWLYGLPGVAGHHSVGMLISTELHQRFGFYSRRLPIAADQLFIKQALLGGASITRCKFVAGVFSTGGTSGSDPAGVITEVFRVQLLTERFIPLQYLLLFIRLGKLLILSQLWPSRGRYSMPLLPQIESSTQAVE